MSSIYKQEKYSQAKKSLKKEFKVVYLCCNVFRLSFVVLQARFGICNKLTIQPHHPRRLCHWHYQIRGVLKCSSIDGGILFLPRTTQLTLLLFVQAFSPLLQVRVTQASSFFYLYDSQLLASQGEARTTILPSSSSCIKVLLLVVLLYITPSTTYQ